MAYRVLARFILLGLSFGVIALPAVGAEKLDVLVAKASPVPTVRVVLGEAKVKTGLDFAHFVVTSNWPGYLTVVQKGTDGQVAVIFPNAEDQENRIDHSLALPRAQWKLQARGPAGTGSLLAVVTPRPVSREDARKLDFGETYGLGIAHYRETE